jgi:hypothetical protein
LVGFHLKQSPYHIVTITTPSPLTHMPQLVRTLAECASRINLSRQHVAAKPSSACRQRALLTSQPPLLHPFHVHRGRWAKSGKLAAEEAKRQEVTALGSDISASCHFPSFLFVQVDRPICICSLTPLPHPAPFSRGVHLFYLTPPAPKENAAISITAFDKIT